MASSTDVLAYRFKPAGHNAPKQKRKYPEPDRRLAQAFEKHLDAADYNHDANYIRSLELIGDIPFSLGDAHSLLLAYQDHPKIRLGGIFLSALYNNLPDTDIVFDLDLDTPPDKLGYKLATGKMLVNRGTAGSDMGDSASAPVINLGKAGEGMGDSASAPVINLGKAGEGMGDSASAPVINLVEVGDLMGYSASAPVINLGKTGTLMGNGAISIIIAFERPAGYGGLENAKLVLKPDDCKRIPELMGYLEEMKQKLEECREDYRKISDYLDGLGPKPGKQIEQDVFEILRRAGYHV